ncbi:MAG: alginate lyase family protein [Acidothermaceae bacterium]
MSHSAGAYRVVASCAVMLLIAGCATRGTRRMQSRHVPLPPLATAASSTNPTTLPIGRESMYDLVNQGTLKGANDLLDNVWDISRYKPATLPATLSWKEDPYHDNYWRFQFYSLRPTSNLLWAYYTTHQQQYLDKLISILRSFTAYDATNPPRDRTRLDYKHGAAFRAMVLVDDYVKLRRSNVLPPDLDAAMSKSIEKLGSFLANPTNFDAGYNHGFTEASALLLVAANFPSFPESATWQPLATSRLTELMQTTVGADGVEIERSPFYHFYVFDFALQVENWAKANGVTLPVSFTQRVQSMVRYATDIVWPNGQVPLIGSSVRLKPAGFANLYAGIAKTDPHFQYVASGGTAGSPPSDPAVLFSTSGQIVLRSKPQRGVPYVDSAQLVMNAGKPSTDHAHLDALAFIYYSGGTVLLPDSGLDTYASGTTFDYFHGTSAHNTVVIDGSDQGAGNVSAGLVTAGSGWEYASASAGLTNGVVQKRSVVMIGRNLVLVIDALTSVASHKYQQLWHLFPGAGVTVDGTTAHVSTAHDVPAMQIVQAKNPSSDVSTYYGNTNPMQGWYSDQYGKAQQNHVVGYAQNADTTYYVTLIATGNDAAKPASVTGKVVGSNAQAAVCAADITASVSISDMASAGERVKVDEQAAKGECGNGS